MCAKVEIELFQRLTQCYSCSLAYNIYREKKNRDKEPHHYKNMKPLNMSFVLVHSCVFSVNIGCIFHQ